MGRHLGLAVLRRGRVVLSAALLAVALVGAMPVTAYADDTVPVPGPTQVPTVSPPSQQQIDDAKSALERLRNGGATTPPVLTQVAGATLPEQADARAPRISDQDWWTIGAAALVLLVLSESTRIGVRRAKHRKEA
jgi:hypothetical protein